ncbi:MAG: hypothetical protein GY751_19525 [Bacteroidetes bacterium]|nr:hypothetical protein [Bacteroidota bacterium]
MRRFLLPIIILAFVSLLITGCATVSSPTGGPRDATPPSLVSSSIRNGSVDFDGKTIIMTFNEYVKLNNPSQNIFSSPPLGNSVSFVTRKNKLFVAFKDSLESNTTYHLNFGNSIQDVNEGNPISNYQFVFATGSYIDSLSISGKLNLVNEVETTPHTLIGLYKDISDSAFVSKAPFYFTFVEEDGSFNLDYLKAGSYQLVALSDANNNYYYDLPNEAIGFLDTLFILENDSFGLELPLFIPEDSEMRVQSFTNAVTDFKIEYKLSKALATGQSFNTYLLSDSISIESKHQISEDRTVITSWLNDELEALVSFQSVLIIDGSIQDTFQHSASKNKKPKQTISIKGSDFTRIDSILLELSSPMYRLCENIVIIDTLKSDTLPASAKQLSDYQAVVKIPETVEEEIVYTLLIPDSCISSSWGQFLPRTTSTFRIVSEEERGTLIFKFDGIKDDFDYLVSLSNSNGKLIKSITVSQERSTWNISNLTEGTYKLKITEDENRNGVWNSGSYNPKKFPEKIYEYPQEFVIRPNWELEETIKFEDP